MDFNPFTRYFSNIGFYGWLLQRISAVVIAVFVIIVYFFFINVIEFNFFCFEQHLYVRVLLIFVYFNVVLHTWIGVWIIFTDYIKNLFLRFFLQLLINFLFFLSFILFLISF